MWGLEDERASRAFRYRRRAVTEEDDIRDAMLFRFWIKAASAGGFPGETASAICRCITPDDYRKVLKALAASKGVNLP